MNGMCELNEILFFGAKSFRPDENYWFNISTDDKFDEVLKLFDEEIFLPINSGC